MSVLSNITKAIEAAKKEAASAENQKNGRTELVFDSLTTQVVTVTAANKRIFLKHNHVNQDGGRYCEVSQINAYFTPERDGKTVDVIEIIQEKESLESKVSKQDKEIAKLKKLLAEKEAPKVEKPEPKKELKAKVEEPKK